MRVYEKHTDPELLEQLQRGSEAAIREIYMRYFDKLFYYAHARVNNREDCKEVVQEVFEVMLEKTG